MENISRRSGPIRITVAVLAVACAALLRAALMPVWGADERPFILFFPAVVFAAWHGRLGAAVVAIILSVVVACYFFIGPLPAGEIETVKQITLVLMFVVVSGAIAVVIERMHRATNGAIEEADQRCKSETALRESEQQLKLARDEAVAASAAKDKFLAVLSHELRTPLNPVLLLASEYATDASLREDVRAAFKSIAENVAMESRLIDDLLDLSRITHGKLELRRAPADLHAIIRDSIFTLETEAAAKQLKVTPALSAAKSCVSGDAVRLKQVITNLVKNAIKFTPESGSIKVTSELAPDGTAIVVAVEDNGIGMTPTERSRAFNPFAQGDHASAKAGSAGGLGLGLAIARQLVEGHGGKIWAESGGRGHGTRVSVKLPLDGA